MKAVIPYTTDSFNGLELKFAIRSLVKYFKDLSGICLIGNRPDWYIGEFIPAQNIRGRKEWSIMSKVLLSPYEDFLYTNDDFFALQPFDSSLPMYYSESLKDHRLKAQGDYPNRIANVMTLYPEGLMFDIHCPMVINLTKYKEANSTAEWFKIDYLVKSVYANFIGGGVQLDDYKIRQMKPVDTSKPFFSTQGYVAKLMPFEEMYPGKSVYEV